MPGGIRQIHFLWPNTYLWLIPRHLISQILGYHGDLLLMVIRFLYLYTVWMCAMLTTFRMHTLLPSSGLEWVKCVSVRVYVRFVPIYEMAHANKQIEEGNIKAALFRATDGTKPSSTLSAFTGCKGRKVVSTHMSSPVAYVWAEEETVSPHTRHSSPP
jgi:hypothetical protein